MQEKTCADCGQTKPVSEFNAHKATADGYETRCKECRARKVEEDRANRAFCAMIQKHSRERLYPSPQYVYGLVDPRTDELRYIGCSHEPNKRLQTHAGKGSYENVTFRKWIAELQAAGLRPEMRILETVAEHEFVREREYRWILKGIRDGLPLLNAEAHTGYGPQRNPNINRHIAESPCADFLTEPRDSPVLDAIGGWGSIKDAGDRWFHKPLPLKRALYYCQRWFPDELPQRLLPMVQQIQADNEARHAALMEHFETPISVAATARRPTGDTTLLSLMNREKDGGK